MSTTQTILSAALLVLAPILVATACDRVHSDPGRSSDTSAREKGASRATLESRGESCSRDLDCSGYLRCFDAKCRVPPAVDGESGPKPPRVRFHGESTDKERVEFYVELATTPSERRRGLMYRPKMHDDWGMLFVYPEADERSFWMKHTRIPLDIIFLDSTGRVVRVVERATPQTTKPRRSGQPARFVLELNGGEAAESGIEPGDRMTVEHVPAQFAPE